MNQILAALKSSLRQPIFLAAVLVLFLAAVGLNGATRFMQLHFKKLPVPLRAELTTLPERLGTWVLVSKDQPIDHEIEETLGTKQYIFRDYLDESIVGASVVARFADKSWKERREMLAGIEVNNPEAVIHLAVTYYTGMVDTVAHVPDRCYTADGYEPSDYQDVQWTASTSLASDGKIPARFICFEDQTGAHSAVVRNVAYFFQVNGSYVSGPVAVRARLQNLRETYGYYAKIEMMNIVPRRRTDLAERRMENFVVAALPHIEKCLPDWQEVTRGGVKSLPAKFE